jgi:lysophospholipase L1-like esterase
MWVADIDPNFGVWHPANATYRHQHRCFDVTYQANSYGARDIERPRQSSGERVVVLGDSFIEGYGIAAEDRISNRLETATGVPHLNFGTSGDFGTTQYYLLYKTLARQFLHNRVLIGILPANDFFDDDPEFSHAGRYRPYWTGEYPNYRLTYMVDNLEDSYFRFHQTVDEPESWYEFIKKLLRRFSYTYCTFLQAIHVMNGTAEEAEVDYTTYSGFYDFTEPQLNRLEYSLERLIALTGDKPVTIFTIPVAQDFERYSQAGPAPLSTALEQFSQKYHLKYVDLLPLMYEHTDWQTYFLSCDAHWNSYGNETATDILLDSWESQLP